jgi:hypothetical protein
MGDGMTVFVFGSNLAGRHGKGAALDARVRHGAQLGVGEGPTGRAYAIPTKTGDLRTRSLDDIRASVATFKAYAASHPDVTFQVTRVGCGLAGYSDDQIGPMFADAPGNCTLPEEWLRFR